MYWPTFTRNTGSESTDSRTTKVTDMPRPSLKETRSEEILDAFMRCVARYGLDGSTLERISAEAGVGRPLLRHYLGNRDQMVAQLLDHVARKFEQLTLNVFNTLPPEGRLDALMTSLFERPGHSSENASVFQALVAASDRHAGISSALLKFVEGFERRIAGEIRREKPGADVEASKIAAAGVTAIFFNTDAIAPLRPGKSWRKFQKLAAQQLLDGVQSAHSPP